MGSTVSSEIDRSAHPCVKCGILTKKGARIYIIERPDRSLFCIRCAAKEIKKVFEETDKYNRKQISKLARKVNGELEVLKSSLTFLRLGSLNDHPDHMQNSDVVIVVQGKTDKPLHAHRFMLSSKSPVFRTMFNVNMSEKATGIIHIDDATLPAVRAMINFCYFAEIDFTDEVTADEVLAVAHKYEIVLLHGICEKHLIKTLNRGNLAKRLRLARKFEAADLEAAASKYLKRYFDKAFHDVLEEFC